MYNSIIQSNMTPSIIITKKCYVLYCSINLSRLALEVVRITHPSDDCGRTTRHQHQAEKDRNVRCHGLQTLVSQVSLPWRGGSKYYKLLRHTKKKRLCISIVFFKYLRPTGTKGCHVICENIYMYCILHNVKRGSFSVVLMRDGWFISTVLHSELSVSHVFIRKRDGVRKRGTKRSKIIQLNSHPPDTHYTPHNYNIPSCLIKYSHCPGLLLFKRRNSMHLNQ